MRLYEARNNPIMPSAVLFLQVMSGIGKWNGLRFALGPRCLPSTQVQTLIKCRWYPPNYKTRETNNTPRRAVWCVSPCPSSVQLIYGAADDTFSGEFFNSDVIYYLSCVNDLWADIWRNKNAQRPDTEFLRCSWRKISCTSKTFTFRHKSVECGELLSSPLGICTNFPSNISRAIPTQLLTLPLNFPDPTWNECSRVSRLGFLRFRFFFMES